MPARKPKKYTISKFGKCPDCGTTVHYRGTAENVRDWRDVIHFYSCDCGASRSKRYERIDEQ